VNYSNRNPTLDKDIHRVISGVQGNSTEL